VTIQYEEGSGTFEAGVRATYAKGETPMQALEALAQTLKTKRERSVSEQDHRSTRSQ